VLLAPSRGQTIGPQTVQVHFVGVRHISFQIWYISKYTRQAGWSHYILVKWDLSDAPRTGMIISLAGNKSLKSHYKFLGFVSLYISHLSESVRCTGSKSRCYWNGGCANSNGLTKNIVPCSVIICRDVYDFQPNSRRQVWNQVQRGAFTGTLPIGKKWFLSCPVHASDVDWSKISYTGYIIEPVESHIWTRLDAMDSIALSTCNACCTIQLLCHSHSLQYCPLQRLRYELECSFNQGYMSDETSGGLKSLHREYL